MKRALALLISLALAACTSLQLPPQPLAQAGVAFDRNAELGAFAEGLADPQSRRAVTPDDPVRVASVSKLVVAVGVMKLVEAGKLDLDRDVSEWLGWSLRNPAFPDSPITLRQLLSHTGSVRDHDDQYAIPLGGSVQREMADPRSWDTKHGPGDGFFTYSNMNFPIVGSIVEKVTGERFDIWMRRNVLEPMRIDGCYNWPTCSDEAVVRAVELDAPDGKPVKDDLHGRRPECPVYVDEGAPCNLASSKLGENGALYAPQGGLRISVRGLERVGRMLLGGGTLDGVRILSERSVNELFQPVWRFDGTNGSTEEGFYCTYGLATQAIPTRIRGCDDNPVGDGLVRQGHAGDAYGMRSGLWLDRARGIGVAFFVTGLGDDPPRGRSAFRASEEVAFAHALSLARPRPR
jgi:CubicO group peptidase (beta-lactamase class C family)